MSLAVFSRSARALPAPPSRAGEVVRRHKIFIHDAGAAAEDQDAARTAAELGLFLAARGHDVEAIVPSSHFRAWRHDAAAQQRFFQREKRDNVALWSCPVRAVSAPLLFWRLILARPEVVVCIAPTLISGLAALCAAHMVDARKIVHLADSKAAAQSRHGGWAKRLARAAETALWRRFDHIATNARRMRDALLCRGVTPEKCELVHDWVNAEAIQTRPRAAPNFYRDMLDLGPQYFIALFSGALVADQGLGVIIEAARRCRAQKFLRFVIVGDGPGRQALVDAAGDLGNLCFLSSQPAEKTEDLLAFADVHLIAQPKNGAEPAFPTKLGQLLASGRPIIAAAEPTSELSAILSGAAILTPPEDGAALAEVLTQAMTRDLSCLGARGRALAHWFTARTILPAFEAAICGVSSGK